MGEQVISLSGKGDVKDIGGKALNLMELMAAGFPVPEGMVIGTEAYERFLDRNKLRERIREALQNLDYADAVKVVRCAETIRGWVLEGEMDGELSEALLKGT